MVAWKRADPITPIFLVSIHLLVAYKRLRFGDAGRFLGYSTIFSHWIPTGEGSYPQINGCGFAKCPSTPYRLPLHFWLILEKNRIDAVSIVIIDFIRMAP